MDFSLDAADPGIMVLRQLIADGRAAFIAQGLRYTTTLLLVTIGVAAFRELLAEFMRECTPELFVSAEADSFALFLRAKALPVDYLDEVLGFEHALVRAALYDESGAVTFLHDPVALLKTLDRGRRPGSLPRQETTIVIRQQA